MAGPAARGSLLPFLIGASAVAACLLLTLSILIRAHSLPTGGTLEAQQWEPAPWQLEVEPLPADEDVGEDDLEGEDG